MGRVEKRGKNCTGKRVECPLEVRDECCLEVVGWRGRDCLVVTGMRMAGGFSTDLISSL